MHRGGCRALRFACRSAPGPSWTGLHIEVDAKRRSHATKADVGTGGGRRDRGSRSLREDGPGVTGVWVHVDVARGRAARRVRRHAQARLGRPGPNQLEEERLALYAEDQGELRPLRPEQCVDPRRHLRVAHTPRP